ncbi:beta-ketoacyl-[acyl-carrier-protein] synthase family protein [Streptomyces lydicus]|uniref:PhlD n=1 Tax=Streptomyces lydicus TaxID=47763 RepID=UPI003806FAD3
MPAHVTRPAIVHPEDLATTSQVLEDIRTHTRDEHGNDHPNYPVWERLIRNTGVEQRHLAYPLDHPALADTSGAVDRNAYAWAATKNLAEKAARRAITEAGLQPEDIGTIITSHTTSWAIPNLDIHLINTLGLRPTVRRYAQTTLACIGGAQSLAKAADFLTARPDSPVLVVAAEDISNACWHQSDTGNIDQIYKALFGDSAGACIVTSEPLTPGLRVDDSWEYLLPDSQDKSYWGEMHRGRFFFRSTRDAVKGPGLVMPHLKEWLKGQAALPADFTLIHAGGPAIFHAVQEGLGLTDEQMHHTFASIRENGNLGGISVLDVLRRTHDTPPADGDRGFALAYGPGFTTTAVTGTWIA